MMTISEILDVPSEKTSSMENFIQMDIPLTRKFFIDLDASHAYDS